jgi:hypothetical protein|tara:strand:+ start:1515 stop:1748 length:234 start_codon:yes stop_codon:yes gene_type:complete
MTYEIETIFYNNLGGVRTREFELFDTRQQAIKHMRYKASKREHLKKQGAVKEGCVKFVDDRGIVKEEIKIGALLSTF